jgi:hypothetical protein
MDKAYILDIIKTTKEKIESRQSQIARLESLEVDRFSTVYILTDDSKTLGYCHKAADKPGQFFVMPCDLYDSPRLNRISAHERAADYSRIRNDQSILVTPLIEALKTDLESAQTNLVMFEAYAEKI